MGTRSFASTLATVALATTLATLPASANELQAGSASAGLVIHDTRETLRDFCATDAEGRMWLTVPGGARYELVTSTRDPAIGNPGDGAFHPFEAGEVRATLAALSFPLGGVHADVFLLPYPRRGGVESAAGAGLILLSPGVRPLSRGQQHSEFVHELGHVVHRALLPDSDAVAWDAYRAMRGIADARVFAPGAAHANRPHEIFAEDFRALFGDALANYSGSIENPAIPRPSEVTGLREFMLALAGAPVAVAAAAQPNPARGAVQFSRRGGAAVALDVFDTQGRRVTSLDPATTGADVRWTWDGRDAQGRPAGAGVFYALPRDAAGPAIRVTRLP